MNEDYPETLIAIAELAVALAGFSGIAVAFGSRDRGSWHPGDRLRLNFLLEASLAAAGFALLTLVLFHLFPNSHGVAWTAGSFLWAVFMPWSLYSSRRRIRDGREKYGNVNQFDNRIVFAIFNE